MVQTVQRCAVLPMLGVMLALAATAMSALPASATPPDGRIVPGKAPPGVDLTDRLAKKGLNNPDLYNQIDRPTCSVFAVGLLVAYMEVLNKSGFWTGEASKDYLNWAANEATGKTDDGAFFADLVAGYNKWGAVKWESYYTPAFNAADIPPDAVKQEGIANRVLVAGFIRENDGTYGLTDKQVDAVKASLDRGVPVAAGFRLNGQLTTVELKTKLCDSCGVTTVAAWGALPFKRNVAAHSMAVIGYQDTFGPEGGGGYFIVRNSYRNLTPIEISYAYFKANVADIVVFNLPGQGVETLAHSGTSYLAPKLEKALPIASADMVLKAAQTSRVSTAPQ